MTMAKKPTSVRRHALVHPLEALFERDAELHAFHSRLNSPPTGSRNSCATMRERVAGGQARFHAAHDHVDGVGEIVGEFLLAARLEERQHPARQAEARGERGQHHHQQPLPAHQADTRRPASASSAEAIQKLRAVTLARPAWSRRRRMVMARLVLGLLLLDVLEQRLDVLALALRRCSAPALGAHGRCGLASGGDAFLRASFAAAGKGEDRAAQSQHQQDRSERDRHGLDLQLVERFRQFAFQAEIARALPEGRPHDAGADMACP